MVESGIKPNEEISKAFGELKINRSIKGLVLTIDKTNKELQIEKQLEKGCDYKEIFDSLPNDDPRYFLILYF
jgi:hypothetical protein